MSIVEMNKQMKLTEHFTLGEMTKTSYKTKDGNIPSHVKRGVLSEDGLDNLLRDVEDVEDRMTSIVADLIDPDFPEDLSEE